MTSSEFGTPADGGTVQQLVCWAALSTAFCERTADWMRLGAPRGGHSEAREAWVELTSFLHDENLEPTTYFDYSADGVDGLIPECRTEEDTQRFAGLRQEIGDAAPVVREFRMLLSADTATEYASDVGRIRGLIETWAANRGPSGGDDR